MCYFTFKYIEFLFYLILSKKDNNGRSSSTGLPLSPPGANLKFLKSTKKYRSPANH